MYARNATSGTWLLLTAMLLAGCGGGGGNVNAGGNTDPGPQPALITAQALEQAAALHRSRAGFRAQPALAAINADQAYARLGLEGRGLPGAGVNIAMMDGPVDFTHPAIDHAPALITDGVPGAVQLDNPITNQDPSHGTSTASILVAKRDWRFTAEDGTRYNGAHGVAYAAQLEAYELDLLDPNPSFGYQPTSLGSYEIADMHNELRFGKVLDLGNFPNVQGFDILNLSFGEQGIIENYRAADLRASMPRTLRTLIQADHDKKILLVWAAGNAHGWGCLEEAAESLCVPGPDGPVINARSPEILPGMMALIPELRPHSVAVAAVDESGTIADYSNRCGIAQQWCLAAPGYAENVAYSGFDQYGNAEFGLSDTDGTSIAAPMVSGGLALMKQYFRGQLSNEQLLARMLATADKTGRYANAAVYGQGLLDLGAAVSPVGTSALATGAQVGSAGADIRFTRMQTGAALGDGLTRSLRGREAAAFDELGAPFWHDLGSFARRVEAPSANALLLDFMADGRGAAETRSGPVLPLPGGRSARMDMKLLAPAAAAPNDHLALAGRAVSFSAARQDGWSASFFTTAGDAAAPAHGAMLAWQAQQASGPNLRAGWVTERETLLGSRTEGAFGALRGDLLFGGAGGSVRAGIWTLSADAELGVTDPKTGNGLIKDIPYLVTSAFGLRAERPAAGDTAWQFSLAQPLRVERGEAALSVPIGRTPEGNVLRNQLSAGLEPSGRQLDLSARWRRPLEGGELRLGAVWTRHPGHRASASPRWALLAGWRADF